MQWVALHCNWVFNLQGELSFRWTLTVGWEEKLVWNECAVRHFWAYRIGGLADQRARRDQACAMRVDSRFVLVVALCARLSRLDLRPANPPVLQSIACFVFFFLSLLTFSYPGLTLIVRCLEEFSNNWPKTQNCTANFVNYISVENKPKKAEQRANTNQSGNKRGKHVTVVTGGKNCAQGKLWLAGKKIPSLWLVRGSCASSRCHLKEGSSAKGGWFYN